MQETRLIDNTSVDNFGNGIGAGNHDYGYGPPVSPVDVVDPDGWVGSDGKGGIFRVVNTDAVSSVSEEVKAVMSEVDGWIMMKRTSSHSSPAILGYQQRAPIVEQVQFSATRSV